MRHFALFILMASPALADTDCPLVYEDVTPRYEASIRLCPEVSAVMPDTMADAVRRLPDLLVRSNRRGAEADDEAAADKVPWTTHVVIRLTAEAGPIVSLRDDTEVASWGSPDPVYNFDGRVFDTVRGAELPVEFLFDDPERAQAVLFREATALVEAPLADPEAYPDLTIRGDVHRSGWRKYYLVETWLVPSTEAGRFGGLATHRRDYGYDPRHIAVTVPQAVFRDYLRPEFRELFAGEPAVPPIRQFDVPD